MHIRSYPRATARTCGWPRSAGPVRSSPPWPTGGCSGRVEQPHPAGRPLEMLATGDVDAMAGPRPNTRAGGAGLRRAGRGGSPLRGRDGIDLWMRSADERSAQLEAGHAEDRRRARRTVPGAPRRRSPADHGRPDHRPRRPRRRRSPITSPRPPRASPPPPGPPPLIQTYRSASPERSPGTRAERHRALFEQGRVSGRGGRRPRWTEAGGDRAKTTKYGGGYCGNGCGAWTGSLPSAGRPIGVAARLVGRTMKARCWNPTTSGAVRTAIERA